MHVPGADPEKNLRGGGAESTFCKMKGIHSKKCTTLKMCKKKKESLVKKRGGPCPLSLLDLNANKKTGQYIHYGMTIL